MSMRAKFYIESVHQFENYEMVSMYPVCPPSFDENGLHEDNTFSKYSPSGKLEITITNPALRGAFVPGTRYYLDFTLAPGLGEGERSGLKAVLEDCDCTEQNDTPPADPSPCCGGACVSEAPANAAT